MLHRISLPLKRWPLSRNNLLSCLLSYRSSASKVVATRSLSVGGACKDGSLDKITVDASKDYSQFYLHLPLRPLVQDPLRQAKSSATSDRSGISSNSNICRFIVPVDSTALQLIQDIKEEFPQAKVSVTRGYKGEIVDIENNSTFLQKLRHAKSDLLSVTIDKNNLAKAKENLDFLSERRTKAVVYGGGAFLVSELAGIVYLTYELGWDLMEPTSYLLGLGTIIGGSAFYAFMRREYTYENAGNHLSDWIRTRVYRKNNFSVEKFENLLKDCKTREEILDPLIAKFLPQSQKASLGLRQRNL
ncbi:hypothetical protein BKA69DRAFT_83060 [Paraphysoderma sedebokerense]|nr:hypothetical protein BKA69DRAFT_83060 [Paraphysoderma sedebokerense]